MVQPTASDLVGILWLDACNESTRTDESDLAKVKLAENFNVGWIVHEDSNRLVLAHGSSSSGEVDHFTIPVGNIIDRVFFVKTLPEA